MLVRKNIFILFFSLKPHPPPNLLTLRVCMLCCVRIVLYCVRIALCMCVCVLLCCVRIVVCIFLLLPGRTPLSTPLMKTRPKRQDLCVFLFLFILFQENKNIKLTSK
jgi:hypothetical protein